MLNRYVFIGFGSVHSARRLFWKAVIEELLCLRWKFEGNISKLLEFPSWIDYNISEKESTHSKSGCLNGIVSTL